MGDERQLLIETEYCRQALALTQREVLAVKVTTGSVIVSPPI